MLPGVEYSKNPSINAHIQQGLAKLPAAAAAKFRRSFRDQDDEQREHTFRELVVGAHLVDLSFGVQHEAKLCGKTPDWTLQDEDGKTVGIVEVVTRRQTRTVEQAIVQSLDGDAGEPWVGFLPDMAEPLYQSIRAKVDKYGALVTNLGVPYVVAIFAHFFACVEAEELHQALFTVHDGGAFALSAALSGVLFVKERGGSYSFTYFANPGARLTLPLLGGGV